MEKLSGLRRLGVSTLVMLCTTVSSLSYAQSNDAKQHVQRLSIAATQSHALPDWYVATKFEDGYLLDPHDGLSKCPQSLQDELTKHEINPQIKPVAPGMVRIYPAKGKLPSNQEAQLSALQQQALWLVDVRGSQKLEFKYKAALYVESYGPCVHLSTLQAECVKSYKRFDATHDILITKRALPLDARLIRSKNSVQNAFSNPSQPDTKVVAQERVIVQWIESQPNLYKEFLAQFPKDRAFQHVCVPNYQQFNASIDGKLRQLISLRVERCQCAELDNKSDKCLKLEPSVLGNHWLAIVEFRGESAGKVWFSRSEAQDGRQFLSFLGLVTYPNSPNDILWMYESHYEGGNYVVLEKSTHSSELKSSAASTYVGL